jgi:hypothetical protein
MPCKALGEGLVEGLGAKKTMVVCMPCKALGEGFVEGLGAKKNHGVCMPCKALGEALLEGLGPAVSSASWGPHSCKAFSLGLYPYSDLLMMYFPLNFFNPFSCV